MASATVRPTTAPALSKPRWIPKARPRAAGGTLSARSASRGALRTPFPKRSIERTPRTAPQEDAKRSSGFEAEEIADLIARFTLYRLLFPTFAGQKATAGGIAMLRDEVLRGQPAYRWTVDHLLPVSDPLELFQIAVEEIA